MRMKGKRLVKRGTHHGENGISMSETVCIIHSRIVTFLTPAQEVNNGDE